MRLMSFALTTPQLSGGRKTVTRRTGWRFLAPGDRVLAVERARGVPVSERRTIAVLRIVDVREEPLRRLIDDPEYGAREIALEGFPGTTPEEWVAFFTRTHHCTANALVTRIEFIVEPM